MGGEHARSRHARQRSASAIIGAAVYEYARTRHTALFGVEGGGPASARRRFGVGSAAVALARSARSLARPLTSILVAERVCAANQPVAAGGSASYRNMRMAMPAAKDAQNVGSLPAPATEEKVAPIVMTLATARTSVMDQRHLPTRE